MAKKPSTGAGGSGARQVSKCSGKNGPANRSIANFSQEHRAENFDARQPSRSTHGRPSPHRGRDLISGDVAARRRTSRPLVITLEGRGCDKFDVLFNGKRVIRASSQPICAAARALHDLGYPDELLLVARHHGANHDAIGGPLGEWRRLRVCEDRGGPRFARWEPLPRRVGAKQGRRPPRRRSARPRRIPRRPLRMRPASSGATRLRAATSRRPASRPNERRRAH